MSRVPPEMVSSGETVAVLDDLVVVFVVAVAALVAAAPVLEEVSAFVLAPALELDLELVFVLVLEEALALLVCEFLL